MNDLAKFDEIPSMTLQDIKETKRYGHTFVRSDVKTVYPPTNTVCGGYNNTHAIVMVLVHDTSSQCALQMYEVSLKYL